MNIKYSTIRRVRITAPMSDRQDILDWVYGNGYNIIRLGPKLLGDDRFDMDKLLIVAEKRIK